MIKCHLSEGKPIYIIVLRFFISLYLESFRSRPFSPEPIFGKCLMECDRNAISTLDSNIKYEASFYTLISVYWFHFDLELKCFPCGRSGEFFFLRSYSRWAFHFQFPACYFTSALFYYVSPFVPSIRTGGDWRRRKHRWKCEYQWLKFYFSLRAHSISCVNANSIFPRRVF